MPAPSDIHAQPAHLRVGHFAASAFQLGLLLLSIRFFRLEESFGLVAITPVIFLGFCVHAWLRPRLKLPFFLALSLAAFFLVLGAIPGAVLAGISLALVGVCHLPVRFGLRVAMLALAGGFLAVPRLGWIQTSWAATVLPVVGAMFMFRSIIYLYDLRTERRPASIWLRLSYFFLLPNVCFLLFPVVDYRTFQRTYYEEPAHRIHQRGIQWILRGIVHLLLYRVVYFHLTPTVAEIRDLAGVALFFVSSYLLYLRISGHFHLIIGLLHLFGFHLPETNHRYLLASSFTDCWRRINIYWTEFMKKIFYYPAFVRLRRGGMLFGMLAATAITFLATWLLHAYQWFWLHGSFPLAMDGLFWGVAGMLALASMLWEAKRGRGRPLGASVPSWAGALRRSLQAFGVFCTICFIWSLWCSASLEQWLAILARARHGSRAQVLTLIGAVLGLLLAGTLAQRIASGNRIARLSLGFRQRAAISTTGALLIALLGHGRVQAALGPSLAAALVPLTGDHLNSRDQERMIAGYYDRLVDREGFGGRVWEQAWVDPDDPQAFVETPLFSVVDGPLLFELPASRRVEYLGALVETNRFGMRDQEYTQHKPPGTFRIVVLGTCYEMGAGVTNDQVWEALTEERLKRELSPRTGLAYEILNFSVPAYNLLNLVTLVREKVPAFAPDTVIVSNHVRSSTDHLLYLATGKTEPIDLAQLFALETVTTNWPHGLAKLLERAQAEPDVDWEARIEDWALREIAAACAEIGAIPVFLNLPYLDSLRGITREAAERRTGTQMRLAKGQGYEYLDLSTAFEGETFESLAIVPSQCCPNEAGHRLMSARFYDALLGNPRILGAH